MSNITTQIKDAVAKVTEIAMEVATKAKNAILSKITPQDLDKPEEKDKPAPASKKYVVAINHILSVARSIGYPIKSEDGILYLYIGTHWVEFKNFDAQDFLGKAALLAGFDKYKGQFYSGKEKLYNQAVSAAHCCSTKPAGGYSLINLQNGTLKVSLSNGIEFLQHNPLDNIHYCLDFSYDPDAECPMFERFLNRVVPDKESQQVLKEYFGYVLLRDLKLEKMLMLYGKKGANGKSVFFEIMIKLFGDANISYHSLEELTTCERARAMADGHFLNYASEIGYKVAEDMLKRIVSNEPVNGKKLYENIKELYHMPRLVFNVNRMPLGGAGGEIPFLRRFIIIPFDEVIPQEERDVNLAKKIYATELSGILNWVLAGAVRLIERQEFSPCAASERALEDYSLEINPVKAFIKENGYYKCEDYPTPLEELYTAYKNSYDDSRMTSNKKFSRALCELGFSHKRVGGNARRFNIMQRDPNYMPPIDMSPEHDDMTKINLF